MELVTKKNDTTLAALVHLSTFSKFLIPFGNFIFPAVFWAMGNKNRFVDENAKQALNFQISLFLYYIFIVGAAISGAIIFGLSSGIEFNIGPGNFYFSEARIIAPVLIILGIAGILIVALFILDIIATVTAIIRASEEIVYKYPLAIPFLRSSNQSKNEQTDNNMKNDTL